MTPHGRIRLQLRRASAIAAACAVLALAAIAGTASAPAASSSVTVSLAVASHVSLANGCTQRPAWSIGSVLAGGSATTATDASVCRVEFTSNNDSAQLRIGQSDATGTAMATGNNSWAAGGLAGGDYSRAMSAYDASQLYVVEDGRVRRSDDAGVTFATSTLIPGWYATAVEVAPNLASVVYACGWDGTNGTLYKSIDSGVSFAALDTLPRRCNDIEAASDQVVWTGWSNGAVRATTNGGTGWASQATGVTSEIKDILALSTTDVWFSAFQGRIGRSTNGGANWSASQPANVPWHANAIAATSMTTAWIVGDEGRVAKTIDGTAWTAQTTGTVQYLREAEAVDANTVFASSNRGTIMKTTNGGTSWTRLVPEEAGLIQGFDMVSATVGFAVGNGNLLVSTTDGSTWIRRRLTGTQRPVFGVSGIDASRAVAVGGTGTILTTSTGNASWVTRASGTTRHLFDVDFVSASTGWAVGDAGTILRSTDGGVTWSAQSSGVSTRLNSIAAWDERRAWAVGDGGVLLHTSNGGSTWTPQASGTTINLRGVSAGGEASAWITGARRGLAYVARTTNGGTTWTTVTTSTISWDTTYDVVATSSQEAWLACGWECIAVTTDGGATWTRRDTGLTGGSLTASTIDVRGDTVVIADGADNAVARSTDRGLTWASTSGSAWSHWMDIDAVDGNTAWAVGDHTAAYRTQPAVAISDYGGANTWSSAPGSTNVFGVCVQDAGLSATLAAGWVEDTTSTPGTCVASDADPWRGVPATSEKAAQVATAGQTGRLDVVWGVRTRSDQPKGAYSAGVTFEALAPNA